MCEPSHRSRITVQLRPDVATEITVDDCKSQLTQNLIELLESVNARIERVFAETTEPDLFTWFTVIVPDPASSALLARLQEHQAVLAAYVKPPESPP